MLGQGVKWCRLNSPARAFSGSGSSVFRLHPRCVEGYQVLGGESECRYFSCLRRKDLHVRGKAAGVGSNPRRLRTRAGDLGSGRKHWCLDARWVVGSVGSSECPWSSPWMVKTPLRPWVKTRGRLMSDSQGCLLCFHLTCLTERSFLPLLPVLEVSLPTGGTSAVPLNALQTVVML